MSEVTKIILRLNSLMVNNMVSQDAIDSTNSEILDYAMANLLRQVKEYVANMEVGDEALHWTFEQEEILPAEEEDLDEQQVPEEEV